MKRMAGYLLVFFPTIVVSSFLKAWVLKILWAWFLVPQFTDVAPGVAQCFGFILLLGLVSGSIKVEAKRKTQEKKTVSLEELSPKVLRTRFYTA
jgi:hypothetical protein